MDGSQRFPQVILQRQILFAEADTSDCIGNHGNSKRHCAFNNPGVCICNHRIVVIQRADRSILEVFQNLYAKGAEHRHHIGKNADADEGSAECNGIFRLVENA